MEIKRARNNTQDFVVAKEDAMMTMMEFQSFEKDRVPFSTKESKIQNQF
jgi:hypothetical protein